MHKISLLMDINVSIYFIKMIKVAVFNNQKKIHDIYGLYMLLLWTAEIRFCTPQS